jgi:hypothetical protein
MELDELLNEVSESVNMNIAFRAKQVALKEHIAEKVNDNFQRIFLPEVRKLWEFACRVAKETDIYISLNAHDTGEWRQKAKTKAFMSIKIKSDAYYNSCKFVSKSEQSWSVDEGKNQDARYFNCWEGVIENFITEEATLKTLDIAKKDFAEYFERFSSFLKNKNENLSKQVARLSDLLNNSSSVKQCENGTVEINIGGKTYVGTLKEES